MNEVMHALLERRSIRAYTSEPISAHALENILEAGTYAPSAMGRQPWHFSAVTDLAALDRLNDAAREMLRNSPDAQRRAYAESPDFHAFYRAPALIVISADPEGIAPASDCALAMQNLFLAAHSLDIGSCWIHLFTVLLNTPDAAPLRELLGVPAGYTVYAAAAFGHGEGTLPVAAPRKEGNITIL